MCSKQSSKLEQKHSEPEGLVLKKNLQHNGTKEASRIFAFSISIGISFSDCKSISSK